MPSIRRVARAGLPTSHGGFGMFVYQATDSKEHVALTTGFEPGTVGEDEAILVRLHSECLTGDVFGSRRCDCGEQLEDSMRLLREQGRGVLLYLRRDAASGSRTRSPPTRCRRRDSTPSRRTWLLACPRTRDYRVAAEMLLDLGIHRAALLTNNPAKIKGLRKPRRRDR